MNRDSILVRSGELINGDRAKDYGPAKANHQRIADGWNVIVKSAIDTHGELTPSHVALMMTWVKTARLLNTIGHEDSWIDLASYAALGGEMASDE